MAYNAKDAALMRAYQRQFPGADLNSLAALAGIPAADVPNYTINTVATPSRNAAFGAVTSKAATETQNKTTTPVDETAAFEREFAALPSPTPSPVTNTTGSGSAFQGGGTIASQAFSDRTPAPVPAPPAAPPPRPVPEDPEVDFTEAYAIVTQKLHQFHLVQDVQVCRKHHHFNRHRDHRKHLKKQMKI